MKTNQSFAKRIKVSRRGKLLVRASGQNHFNAKERRVKQLAGKRLVRFRLKPKARGRFLPHH
jgi:ribosomal protein L35